MVERSRRATLAALMLLIAAGQARAASPAEERLLGGARDYEQMQSYLPFTRSIGVSGVVARSLAESATAAGVPAAAMVDALRALATTIDIERDIHEGDRFYVRYEQTYTLAGAPIDVARVQWAEVQLSPKRTVGIYRFRPRNGPEQFWTGNAEGTEPPQIRLPLDAILVSSGFGMRADPFDQPAVRGMGMGPLRAPPAPPLASPLLKNVNTATPLGRSLGLTADAYSGFMSGFGTRAKPGAYAMHEGVDLVAPIGTPIYAAGDGIVKGAEPKGRYGNWVEIEHPDRLATVYGHLSAFAPGIAPGAEVHQGDLIGFVGTTGRTTGPHVHFELLVNGRPTNPMVHPAVRHPHLLGPDLVAFRKLVASEHAERDLEVKTQ